MGSKGRVPPPRWPLPGPEMIHRDPFIPGIRPPPGAFFEMLPPSEILEQKLAAQHVEMQRLGNENHRLAATHGALRQELAAAQQELQRLQAHIGAMKSEKEQQMRTLLDKVAKMEADVNTAEPLKMELQQAHSEAENLTEVGQELVSKVQQLTEDLQRNHADVQQVPALMFELERLRQEYQNCRITYDYEKKLYNDHFQSLQLMEKNYHSMAREVEKLQAELANATNLKKRSGGNGDSNAYKENDASGHQPADQNAYDGSFGIPQGHWPPPAGASPYGGHPPGDEQAQTGYGAPRGPGYEVPRTGNWDAYRGANYDVSRGAGYDPSRGAGYDASRATNDASRGSGYNASWVPGYDASKGTGYDNSQGTGYDASQGAQYDASQGTGFDVSTATGYSSSIGAGYDESQCPGYDASGGTGYVVSGGPSHDATRASAGYEAPRGTGYGAPRGAGGVQASVLQGNSSPYGSTRPPTHVGETSPLVPAGNVWRR